ncbi:aspartate carbamoyltransferase regulatory subunit [Patescibacteria group bacterium]|nr:aspartate carbamoyltransferase regulatory subunit [Patescibacteria group bacterium]MBU0963800.1 aspartate carbamoyltransferase regulatory subunit [Patescibacteria group bacterium]
MRAYKVYAIKDGTVIDHIPDGQGMGIIDLLNLRQWNRTVTLGIGFHSKKHGKKDVIKIEDKELTPAEVNKIAIVAPTATMNIIRNHKIVKKFNVELPETLEGIVKCPNPACVTNHDPVATTRFFKENGKKIELRCAYCERYFKEHEIEVI